MYLLVIGLSAHAFLYAVSCKLSSVPSWEKEVFSSEWEPSLVLACLDIAIEFISTAVMWTQDSSFCLLLWLGSCGSWSNRLLHCSGVLMTFTVPLEGSVFLAVADPLLGAVSLKTKALLTAAVEMLGLRLCWLNRLAMLLMSSTVLTLRFDFLLIELKDKIKLNMSWPNFCNNTLG